MKTSCVWVGIEEHGILFPVYNPQWNGKTCGDIVQMIKDQTGMSDLTSLWIDNSVCNPNDLILEFLTDETVSLISITTADHVLPKDSSLNIRLFLNTSMQALLEGISLQIPANITSEQFIEMIHKCFLDESKDSYDVDLYCPGARLFTENTVLFHIQQFPMRKPHFYAVIHKPVENIDDIIPMKNISSLVCPLFQASLTGASQMWALLYWVASKAESENLIASLASNYRFGPMITSLVSLSRRMKMTKRKFLAITATLQTIIVGILSFDPIESLDHTLECLSAIASMGARQSQFTTIYQEAKLIELYNEREMGCLIAWAPDLFDIDVAPIFQRQLCDQDVLDIFKSTYFLRPVEIYGLYKAGLPCISKRGEETVFCLGLNDKVGLLQMNKALETLQPRNAFSKAMSAEDCSLQIGRNKVEQIVCILVERSSLSSKHWEMFERFLQEYDNQSVVFRTSTIHCIFAFNTVPGATSWFTTAGASITGAISSVPHDGKSCLYDAISLGIDALYAFNSTSQGPYYLSAKLRLVMVAVGKDSGSITDYNCLVSKAKESGVLLDALLLEPPEGEQIPRLCHLTGGSCVVADSEEKLTQIVKSEAFLSSSYRHIAVSDSGSVDDIFPNAYKVLGDRVERLFSVPDFDMCTKKLETNNRMKRIREELKLASGFNDPNIEILFTKRIDDWRAFLRGPDGTPYAGKWFYMLISFPPEYPKDPPVFRFHSVPLHINVAKEGHICANLLSVDYSPQCTVTGLLYAILLLLGEPNYDDPMDPDIMALYREDPKHFEECARQQAEEYGKDSVEEWREIIQGEK